MMGEHEVSITHHVNALNIDGAGRRVHTSSGRRLLRAMLESRDEHGRRIWTLERLARETRSSTNALSSLAAGLTKHPSLELASRLHKLGVHWESWLEPARELFPRMGREEAEDSEHENHHVED
jgi:hypothetical protein